MSPREEASRSDYEDEPGEEIHKTCAENDLHRRTVPRRSSYNAQTRLRLHIKRRPTRRHSGTPELEPTKTVLPLPNHGHHHCRCLASLLNTSSMTNVQSRLIIHATQGQAPSKLTNTRSRRSDILMPRCALHVNQDHYLPRMSPRYTTARSRGAMPHESATCNPSCAGQSATDHGHRTTSSGAAAPT
jgi:hypothetical protein